MNEEYVDMRKYETFPAAPRTSHEIWCYPGDAWKIACAMAGKYDARQFNAYRALYFAMQDDDRYKARLVRSLEILQRSRNIHCPAAIIYTELAAALSSAEVS